MKMVGGRACGCAKNRKEQLDHAAPGDAAFPVRISPEAIDETSTYLSDDPRLRFAVARPWREDNNGAPRRPHLPERSSPRHKRAQAPKPPQSFFLAGHGPPCGQCKMETVLYRAATFQERLHFLRLAVARPWREDNNGAPRRPHLPERSSPRHKRAPAAKSDKILFLFLAGHRPPGGERKVEIFLYRVTTFQGRLHLHRPSYRHARNLRRKQSTRARRA